MKVRKIRCVCKDGKLVFLVKLLHPVISITIQKLKKAGITASQKLTIAWLATNFAGSNHQKFVTPAFSHHNVDGKPPAEEELYLMPSV